MMAPTSRHTLEPRWENVSDLPTTPFQQTLLGTTTGLTAIALAVYSCRLYIRANSRHLGLDDCLLGLAAILAAACNAATYMFFKYGYAGFPMTSPERQQIDLEAELYWIFVMQCLYNPILALVKSSVLLLLLRIGGHRQGVKRFIHGLNAVNLMLMVAIFFVVIFQQIPIRSFWDLSVPPTRIIDSQTFDIVTACITIITDILVLSIPIWLFAGLQMRLGTKMGLILVFMTSGLVTVIGILRLIGYYRAFKDLSYDFMNTWSCAYSQIESDLAIISACAPALRPLLARWCPRLFQTQDLGSGGGATANYGATSTIGGTKPGSRGGLLPGGGGGGGGRKATAAASAGRGSVASFQLREMGRGPAVRTEIRGHTPDASEEEIMTPNGIMKKTQFVVSYDVKTLSDRREFRDMS